MGPSAAVPAQTETLEHLIALGHASISELAIICVVNLAENDAFETSFDRKTEYFSEKELDDIVGLFRTAGFYTDVFVGEQAFIRWIEGGGHHHFARPHIAVYNTAQSGDGPSRKSLIPSFCAYHGILTLNSDGYTAALARHKFHVNSILLSNEISVPKTWWYLGDGKWHFNKEPPIGQEIIVKSSYESASIGVQGGDGFTFSPDVFPALNELVSNLGQPAVLQEFICGREAETPVVKLRESYLALSPVGISVDGDVDLGQRILSYERVAHDQYGFYDFPEKDMYTVKSLQDLALRTATVLNLGGFSRVDTRIDAFGNCYVTDVSTTPHLVSHSSYAYRFGDFGGGSVMMKALVGSARLRP